MDIINDKNKFGGQVTRTAERALFSVLFAGFLVMSSAFVIQLIGGAAGFNSPEATVAKAVVCALPRC